MLVINSELSPSFDPSFYPDPTPSLTPSSSDPPNQYQILFVLVSEYGNLILSSQTFQSLPSSLNSKSRVTINSYEQNIDVP